MQPVAAVNPHDGRLTTVIVGVRCWPTERFRPVRRKPLGVLRMVSVAECMANHFVLQYPCVPRVGQFQHSIDASHGFIDRLYVFRIHDRIMQHFEIISEPLIQSQTNHDQTGIANRR